VKEALAKEKEICGEIAFDGTIMMENTRCS